MAQKLSGAERAKALSGLAGWSELSGRDAIARKFVFKGKDFEFEGSLEELQKILATLEKKGKKK